jgi:hypothetical protein
MKIWHVPSKRTKFVKVLQKFEQSNLRLSNRTSSREQQLLVIQIVLVIFSYYDNKSYSRYKWYYAHSCIFVAILENNSCSWYACSSWLVRRNRSLGRNRQQASGFVWDARAFSWHLSVSVRDSHLCWQPLSQSCPAMPTHLASMGFTDNATILRC